MAASMSFKHLLASPAGTQQDSLAHRLPAFPQEVTRCYLLGPINSGLVSLAIQFAVNHVLLSGSSEAQALILCRQPVMEDCLPALVPAGPQQDAALAHVKLRYLASDVELLQYTACLHCASPPPHALVVHNFSSFFLDTSMDRNVREPLLARTLAALVDATEAISRMTGRACPLLVTDEVKGVAGAFSGPGTPSSGMGQQEHNLHLIQRWLPLVLDVTGGPNTWSLGVHASCSLRQLLVPELQQRVQYQLTPDALLVGQT